ncbi:uncharacterized protein A4U43_C10F16140 [Asparagus officinalis]|uniref:Uncharacterized protein n=1 Tax=Asparagus officinalis TaxID=4686 RepID=A0A5P1E6I0_ASPOF|nr:uncharacterized protein A4U43_C10F16140 [Asparagus officinalis]
MIDVPSEVEIPLEGVTHPSSSSSILNPMHETSTKMKKDETYKIDLTKPMDDDKMDDDCFFDEFANVNNKYHAHEANANEFNANEVANENDNEDAINVDENANNNA